MSLYRRDDNLLSSMRFCLANITLPDTDYEDGNVHVLSDRILFILKVYLLSLSRYSVIEEPCLSKVNMNFE